MLAATRPRRSAVETGCSGGFRPCAGWIEGAFPGVGMGSTEDPALRFPLVVDRAQPGEVPPGRRSAVGVVDLAVVELEVLAAVAPGDAALTTGDDHRGAQLGRD